MFSSRILSVLLVVIVLPNVAFAYLDPATISMVLQVVIAGAVGAFIFLRGGISQAKQAVLGLFKKKKVEDPPEEN